MDTRKVQVTGGSTFTVSIPKEWATDSGVEAGTEVAFYPDGDSLLLSPRGDDEVVEGTLDIGDLHGRDLTRAVVTMYVSGFDVIRLETGQVTAEQRRSVRDATQGLVGLEVVEETGEHVVLQDLLDSGQLSVHNAVTRMRLIATTMLADAVRALIEDDDDLAADVIERDDDVDRLWFMVSRVFRSTLRNPGAAAEIGLGREACFDYHSSARQLERIADHSAKIATIALDLGTVPEDVGAGLDALHEDAIAVVERSMDAFLEEDSSRATRLANQAREDVEAIDEHTRNADERIRNLDDAHQAQFLGLVIDSLSRTADYGGNIAETALQKAAPRP
ncbi:phosphate uptake regulator PhoU [Halalkalicoccus jeotgali]|uniref:Phosphate uptake regulator PhoU n=1 Tax=Halalkalicoccus jeotgali (strain DSM 18796 / CECT 7217 / JCM 14584 / KCTC 4019 / B3) TaxID=795797 RepID=D8J8Q0_HALJB|nr:phosphate uptake regulator PhoU [Halalkalicoccus jeotgali]ADJ14235.1 phosphate uptake regulator, PhoU [Halalkalicoccus jeotgali B3]ELY40497.1 phosphate uptake regulator PhoU [Halalkalicoccus jeotgali B3]